MTSSKLTQALAAALIASLALAGCKKEQPDTTTGAATGTQPMTAPTTTPAPGTMPEPMPTSPAATAVSVTGITLGKEAGADKMIATPMTSFAPTDPIVVSVATDGAASNADIATRLVFQDGQTAGEQNQTVNTTGMETTNFTFTNANPWPAGSYTVDVMVNGTPARSTAFTVK